MAYKYRVGVDEAGRGPLAGPVAVGVVAVPVGFDMRLFAGVKDSKQLTPQARERLYAKLMRIPKLRFSVVMVGAHTIDTHGITTAIRIALARALRRVEVSAEKTYVLLDGSLRAPVEYSHQKTIIRGDQTELLIGAASILAKVTRDRYMIRMHKKYPAYGFDVHKGYGTVLHRARIAEHGLCPLHRKTFCHPQGF